jgi:ABC-type Fe3+ transport system permease subunit
MARSASTYLDTVIGALGLAALLVSGMVLATSWLIPFPTPVLLVAAAVALFAMTAVLTSAYRASRSSGTGVPSAIGRSLNELRKFWLLFF